MYSEETKTVILTLLKNLMKEKRKGSLLFSLDDPIKRASGLTGISTAAIRTWIKDDDNVPTKKPETSTIRSGPKQKFDSFDVKLIVTKVHKMFTAREVVTIRRLKQAVKEEAGLEVSKTTLWRCLKAEGFAFKKTGGNRRILCER